MAAPTLLPLTGVLLRAPEQLLADPHGDRQHSDDGDRLASGDVVGVERHRRCLTTRPGRGHRDDGPERGGHTSDGGTDDAPWGPATSHDGSAGPGSPSEVQVEMTSSQAMINGATLG